MVKKSKESKQNDIYYNAVVQVAVINKHTLTIFIRESDGIMCEEHTYKLLPILKHDTKHSKNQIKRSFLTRWRFQKPKKETTL